MAIIQYPGTNFHDINLDWVLEQVKNLLTEWGETRTDWENLLADNTEFKSTLENEWDSFHDYIISHIDEDVPAEVVAEINRMASDGRLLAIITADPTGEGSALSDAVGGWISTHLHPEPTDVMIDDSLTVPRAAADAKAAGDAIADLKGAFDEITETIYSTNIFDQENATTTNGKYLNYNTGNEGTLVTSCYINDYIPIEPETQYIGSVFSKENGQFLGGYAYMTCFYNQSKEFISGVEVPSASAGQFTTPANAYFMRFSLAITSWEAYNFMFEKGTTRTQSYVPYSETIIIDYPIIIVDPNGKGDYTSIRDAVNNAADGSTIIVMPGTYVENVKAWTKEIHIIGISRDVCILKDTSGNYSTPPLEIGAGSVENMTIIELANGAGTENLGAYAVHVESNNLYNKTLLIKNCYIWSDSSSAVGMGLRGGCSVRFEDCEIICAGARNSTGAGPIYFHDADASAYWGTANVYLHNNVLRNTASSLFSMLTINSIHPENTTYMHIMYNIFVRSDTPALPQKYNTWNTGGVTGDGWNGLNKMYLASDCFGNNQSDMTYTD